MTTATTTPSLWDNIWGEVETVGGGIWKSITDGIPAITESWVNTLTANVGETNINADPTGALNPAGTRTNGQPVVVPTVTQAQPATTGAFGLTSNQLMLGAGVIGLVVVTVIVARS